VILFLNIEKSFRIYLLTHRCVLCYYTPMLVKTITAVAHKAQHPGVSHPRFPGVNMRKTAELLGIHKSHLSRTLRGECRAGLEMSIKIAKAFGITVEELNSYYKQPAGGPRGGPQFRRRHEAEDKAKKELAKSKRK
jgi:transcriptional regulator with XRE-family HTH domain